jgi:large subunit ribosomal protein L14
MIQKGTYLNVIDNSGVKSICCIHVSDGYRKKYAKVGDFIIASVKSVRFKKDLKVEKGSVVKALIIRTKNLNSIKKEIKNNIKFNENCAILLTKQKKYIGTRLFGGIQKQFRYTKFSKLLSMSSGLIK